jgi:hypothetical protein
VKISRKNTQKPHGAVRFSIRPAKKREKAGGRVKNSRTFSPPRDCRTPPRSPYRVDTALSRSARFSAISPVAGFARALLSFCRCLR